MTLVGADLEGLDRLRVEFERGAGELERLSAAATRGAQELSGLWYGHDAAEFRAAWLNRHRPLMSHAADALVEAARTIERNRSEQDHTSADVAGAGLRPGGITIGAGGGSGLGGGAAPSPGNPGGDFASRTGKINEKVRIAGWEDTDGDLFASPGGEYMIHPNDIDQQSLGDCYFVSALAGLADTDPGLIRNAIVDNGDGTYTVTLWEKSGGDYRPVEVTVNGDMPVTEVWNADTDAWEERGGYTAGPADDELWPRIFEKAYASHLGDGDLVAGYAEIIGGDGADALTALTGIESETVGTGHYTIDELADLHDDGVLLPASHRYLPGTSWWDKLWTDTDDLTGGYDVGEYTVYTRHQYWIDEIDAEAGIVTVRNPWGYQDDGRHLVELTYDEFVEAFREIDHNPVAVPGAGDHEASS